MFGITVTDSAPMLEHNIITGGATSTPLFIDNIICGMKNEILAVGDAQMPDLSTNGDCPAEVAA